jgi:uncharacterized protein YbjT (DUF2867 family)
VTALVMGATGHVGSGVVAGLRERGAAVRALSRQQRDWPDGVEGVVADPMAADGLVAAADGVEAAFVMSGYDGEAGLLAALPADALVVLLSASSAPLGDANPLSAMHAASERAVVESGHPHVFLRPCSFMSNLDRWSDQLATGDVVRTPFADVPVALTDPADIAAVAVLALTEPGHAGATYRLSGPEALTPPEQVAVLGEVLGRELRHEAEPDDEVVASIFRAHPELESEVQPTVRKLLGRPAGTVRAYLQQFA